MKVLRAKYQIIYADPPWEFKTYSQKGKGKSPEKHYPCLSLGEICNLNVKKITDENCALFLWVTSPHLQHGLKVIEEWGFIYKTIAFIWVKRTKTEKLHWGCGYWTRANGELCLLATKGKPVRQSASVHQIIEAEKGRHSEKPEEVRSRIVKLMGNVPRIELFARSKSPGWNAIGDEIDGKDIRDVLRGPNANP